MVSTTGSLLLMADAAWRVSVVLGSAWAITRLAGRRSAALRHAIWAAALVAAIAVPLVGGTVPGWRVPILPAPADAMSAALGSIGREAVDPAPAAPTSGVHRAGPVAAPATPAASASITETGPARRGRSAADWIGLVWVAIAAAFLGRYAASVAAVHWVTRDAELVGDPRWQDALDVAVAQIGLSRTPRLLQSAQVTVPFTSGVLRPALVMPAAADQWTDERVRVVLLHELAHVLRRDCLVQALSHVACALYWFNPLVWIAARRLRAERERACDDLVLASGTRGPDYAQHLLDIARSVTAPARLTAAALAMARPSELEGRLLAILDAARDRRPITRQSLWRGALTMMVLALPAATLHPVARASGDTRAARPSAALAQATPTTTAVDEAAPNVARSSRAISRAVASGVSGGIAGGVRGGVAQGVAGGVAGGVARGVAGGVAGGVSGGITDDEQSDNQNQDGKRERTLSPAVLQALTEALHDSDADVRKQAMQALARFHSPVVYDTLIGALKDSDAEVREQAVFALGQFRDQRAGGSLLPLLRDEAPAVREQAAFALGQLRHAAAVPALSEALKDANEDVREQALFALSQIRDTSAVPAITAALKDADPDVRQQAAFALSQLGDAQAVPALIGALKDAEEDVREQAAFALSQVGTDAAVDALTAALKDVSPEVRKQVVFALTQIADGQTERRSGRHSGESAAPFVKPSAPPQPKPGAQPKPAPQVPSPGSAPSPR